MTVRVWDDVAGWERLEELRTQAEALGLNPGQVAAVEAMADRLRAEYNMSLPAAFEQILRTVQAWGHAAVPRTPRTTAGQLALMRAHARRAIHLGILEPLGRLADWLKRRIGRSRWGQP